MTDKTRRFLKFIANNPGVIVADIHRAVGCNYAHGHHRYTYDTVNRMIRNGYIDRNNDYPHTLRVKQ